MKKQTDPQAPVDDARELSERINASLDDMKVNEHHARVRLVAEATGRSERTATRYLNGLSFPRSFDRLERLASGLGVLPGWLAYGEGPKTQDELRFIRLYRQLPSWKRKKFLRFLFLYNSGSRKILRLANAFNRGQITADQLLTMF